MRPLLLAAAGLAMAIQAQAAASPATPVDESSPQAAMLAAEERFRQAEKEFIASQNAEARAALGANATAPAQNSLTAPASRSVQRTAQPAAQTEAHGSESRREGAAPKPEAARQDAGRPDTRGSAPNFIGTPETGYSAIWTDPATGDNNISVIAPSVPTQTTPAYPMVIEPIVGGGNDWSGNWDGNAGGGSANWGNSNWGNSWGGYQPPPFSPGYYPPQPGMNGHMPPFNPNYRPLRPNNPSLWQPGPGPYPGPGMNQPPMAGNPGFQPGWTPPANPGSPWPGPNPNNPAIQPPLPGMPGSPNPGNPAIQPPLPGMPGSFPGGFPPPASGNQPPNFNPGGMQPPAGFPGGMPGAMRPLHGTPGGWGHHMGMPQNHRGRH